MTSTRYLLFRAALAFGYSRKNIRMGDAAAETHLLKDAETYLGEALWSHLEHIEALSVEYWNLRKITTDRNLILAQLTEGERELALAYETRADFLGATNHSFNDLLDERQAILDNQEELARQRDQIVATARDIRRSYDGVKLKWEVLEKEYGNSDEELEKITAKLTDLKKKFSALKIERQIVARKIAEGDSLIDTIEAQIAQRKKDRRGKASEAFQHIGEGNQKMSTLRAELSLLDARMRQLYSQFGRHISRSSDPACMKLCKSQQGMIEVMRVLRKSIRLNHKLAEIS